MPSSASYPSSTFDDITTNLRPDIINPGETMDMITKDRAFLWFMANVFRKDRVIGRDTVINVLKNQATGGGTFEGYDVLPGSTWQGSDAMLFGRGHHWVPIQISATEEWDLEGPDKIKDRIVEMYEQAARNMENKLYEAAIVGNASDTKSIIGLEQAIPDNTHDDPENLDSSTAIETDNVPYLLEWLVRQDTSVFGGITREAWAADSDDFDGDGNFLTPVVVDFFNSNNIMQRAFGFNNGALTGTTEGTQPTAGLKMLYQLVGFVNRGQFSPDIIFSSNKPWYDYTQAMAGRVAIRRGPTEYGGVTFPFDHFEFEGMAWLYDRNLVTQNATDGTAGHENLYILNSDTIEWWVDPRVSFGLVRAGGPHNQMASINYILARHQMLYKQAGVNARIFGYPDA